MKKERGLYRRKRSPFWWICYTDKLGNTIRETTGVKEKSLAREILNKRRTEVAEGKFLDKRKVPKITFTQLCNLYWDKRGQHLRMYGLESVLGIWKDHFGKRKVASIRQSDVEDFLAERFGHLAPSTRNRHMAQLKAMLNWAIEVGELYENPAAKLKRLREIPRNRYLTLDEISRLLTGCSHRLRQIVEFALHTGMRKSEILDLRRVDADLKQKLIWIRTSHKADPRHIPMDEVVWGILNSLPKKSMYVFTSPRGGKYKEIKEGFKRALQRGGIEDFTFHDLRHTFASHLVMNGTSIQVVSGLLGHSNLKMTQRYAHLAPDYTSRAIGVLDEVFKQKPDLRVIKGGKK